MLKKQIIASFLILLLNLSPAFSQEMKFFPGADEKTPSRSQYFSWINNTNEGTTEEQTLINLDFYHWLKQEYGMVLDIYAFDAGAIDGKNFYGSMLSDRFKKQFPSGFGPIAQKAALSGTRLGIWGGPDGFGITPEEEKARIETMVSLCRDFNWELFKMDAVCGQLRPEKYDAFDRMMTECRKYSPDLVLLNHRLNLGPGTKHSTTFLLGGAETYIDVHMANAVTAPHHRVTALSRDLPPKLTRLTEDHGVCLSSCLDYWEDDLILQAFNRNLILAPEIYGNPWLLSDKEYPKLARIFNLHKLYRNIMVNGIVLPEVQYGKNAVSRGDGHKQFITLRNLNWNPTSYDIKLDESSGLKKCRKVLVKTYHPTEKVIGVFEWGSSVPVEVLPFRSCLLKVADASTDKEFNIEGIDYQIVNNSAGKLLQIELLGMPGTEKTIRISGNYSGYKTAVIDGEKSVQELLSGKTLKIKFKGDQYKDSYHRKVADMTACAVPADAEAIYEATCFAADNNSLEARELKRSGPTNIPEVKAARDAFFNQKSFVNRETWDKYLFDGNQKTAFSISVRWSDFTPGKNAFRIDFGKLTALDSLVLWSPDEFSLQPLKSDEGEYARFSADLKNWTEVPFNIGTRTVVKMKNLGDVRYFITNQSPLRLSEAEGYKNGKPVDRSLWRASNLFAPYVPSHWDRNQLHSAQNAWSCKFVPKEIAAGSYLCIAVNGEHGTEGAVAGVKIDGIYFGCPDRAPSFRSNTWEVGIRTSGKNYTYYLPLSKDMIGKEIEAFVLGFNKDKSDLHPEVYLTAYPIPFEKKILVLK